MDRLALSEREEKDLMASSKIQSFKAVLEPDQTRLRWVIARIPFDPAKMWPVRRGLRVRGEISLAETKGESANSEDEGFAFRTSLFPDPRREDYILLVNKKMQAATGAAVGSQVRIRLEPDLEEREATIPPELARALKGDRRLPKWFAGLSYSWRKEIGAWVSEPKTAEGREKRAESRERRAAKAIDEALYVAKRKA